MPSVTLSTGETVHFFERFTHRARKQSKEALGIVWRQDDEGELQMVKEIAESSFDRANEVALLAMIAKVGEKPATQEWLDSLPVSDYDALMTELLKLKKGSDEKKKA